MTVLLPYGRTLSKQLATRSGILTRLVSTARVARPQTQSRPSRENPDGSHTFYLAFGASRSYATAAGRPASKPKAHTGRTKAKSTTGKTATKPKAQPKKKKKSTKAKAKPKPKPVKKAPSASALKREATQKRVSLKEKALFRKEPKQLPEGAWIVYTLQAEGPKGVDQSVRLPALAARYKQISPEEREALNQTSNENKAKNDAAYKGWVQTYTPLQIREANIARASLLREAKANKVKRLAPYRPIKDDRLPKKATTAYNLFLSDRMTSGDFKGMTTTEAFRLVSREWKALSAGERKPYNEKYEADRTRYFSEAQTVYGTTSNPRARA